VTSARAERPRTSRLPRTARRAQLLGVALEVFVEQGYHAASMDDIAERAGVSKPVLYQHFPGKLDLYRALLANSRDEIIEGVRQALASTSDNSERVRAAMALWFDYVADHGMAFRLVIESDMTSDPEVRDLVESVTSESATAISKVIVEDTQLPEPVAQLLASCLVGMGHVGARSWLSVESAISRDEAVDIVSTLAWRGIGGFPKP
jgi:AcrR family transcriptional regulator